MITLQRCLDSGKHAMNCYQKGGKNYCRRCKHPTFKSDSERLRYYRKMGIKQTEYPSFMPPVEEGEPNPSEECSNCGDEIEYSDEERHCEKCGAIECATCFEAEGRDGNLCTTCHPEEEEEDEEDEEPNPMGRHPTIKRPGDPTYSRKWSGVSNAPTARGVVCSRCGGHVHREGDSYYCPYDDNYVRVVPARR